MPTTIKTEDSYYGVRNKVLFTKYKNKQNNYVVSAMYAMYKQGKSLDKIAKTYRKTRQAVYDVFRSRGYELRSKQMKGLQVIDGINFTEMKQGYLRGTYKGKRILAHYYIWEKEKGIVPNGYVIQHLNSNPSDNKIENLALVKKEDMARVFNPKHYNQFTCPKQ
jgi:predicted DNA-binding protein YlxM (UPF0122 family)